MIFKYSSFFLVCVGLLSIVSCSNDADDAATEANDSTTTTTIKDVTTTTEPEETVYEIDQPVDEVLASYGASFLTGLDRSQVPDLYKGSLGVLPVETKVIEGEFPTPVSKEGSFPLTGLSVSKTSEKNLNRSAAVVKIDNGPGAGSQQGINKADLVFEEPVEGGITRLAAVFHSNSGVVGPVRSGRTTDISLMSSLGTPFYLYSGANTVTESLLKKQEYAQNRNFDFFTSLYYRDSSKRAPSNIYTDLENHWDAESTPPVPQFFYRSSADTGSGAEQEKVSVSYRSNAVVWEWGGEQYSRLQRGRLHLDASSEQVTTDNVLVLEVVEQDTGMVDASTAMVPEYVFVGAGKATVFTDGKRVEGVWIRPSLDTAPLLVDEEGVVIKLTPGRTWIQIIPEGSGALS